ncbi:MAG: outer membrane beta-barrel protein [Verrucomicrobia bacterium]|nr:outer membrane beta-barrel protein [Verrucomicrobiota bacterium]
MKSNHTLAVAFLAAASTIAAHGADAPAPAVTFDGYAVVQATSVDTTSSLDLYAAKFGATGKFGNVTGYASLYYGGAKTDLLDAYFTVDVGGGLSITTGKFLSYMGYEAFDVPNMTQISYANTQLSPVPAYHTGIKADYSTAVYGAGVAVVDSLYGYGNAPYKGDGSLRKPGLEAYYTYKGIKDVTIWFGAANEVATKYAFYDLWVSYAVSKTDSIGAEYIKIESEGSLWLLAYTKALDSKWSLTSRISGDSPTGGENNLKYTLSPSYSVNEHFIVRAEASYVTSYGTTPSASTFAAQTIFKF